MQIADGGGGRVDLSIPGVEELRARATAAGGVDPYQELERLTVGKPDQIRGVATAFQRAGGELDQAWTTSMSAQRQIGAGFTNNHEPVLDRGTHLAALPAGFRDAGTQLVDASRRVTAVADDLTAHTTAAQGTVDALTATLRTDIDGWNTRVNGMPIAPGQEAEARRQRDEFVAGLVSKIAAAGGQVRSGVIAYEGTVASAVGLLADQGHISPEELASAPPPDAMPAFAPSTLGAPPGAGYAADPVNTGTGNFLEVETDLAFSGLTAGLTFTRTYNSRDDRAGAFGPRWSSWASARLIPDPGGAWFTGPDGQRSFLPIDEHGAFIRVPGVDATVERTDAGLRLCWTDGRRWDFDGAGRPRATSSGPGTEITFTHDEHGRLTGMAHTGGRGTTFAWDGGHIVEATTSDGRSTTYTYRNGHLVDVDGGRRRYGIDVDGRLATVTDADGVVELVNSYDEHGRVLTQLSPFGRLVRFEYLPGDVTVVSDDDGGPRNTYLHDPAGRLIGAIDGHGHTQRIERDGWGHPVRVVERGGAVTTSEWDDRGRLVRRTLPIGVVTEQAWDDDDRLVSSTVIGTDGTVARTQFAYAGVERVPSEITDPEGGVTRLRVTGGVVAEVTDADGVTVILGHDADGALTSATDADGGVARIERDGSGLPCAVVSPAGRRTELVHDRRGLLVERRDPGGAVWRFEHTPAGRLAATVDPLGARTEARHGDHGEPTEVVDALGVATALRHDTFGNLAAVTSADGAKTTFAYDALCRLSAWTDPAGGTWLRDHDADGHLVASTDPAGVRRTATYDTTGQVTAVHDGLTGSEFGYDGFGRTSAHIRPDGTALTATFDRCGRTLTETAPDGGTTRYTWSPAGRLRRVVSPEGRVRSLRHDACGRPVETIDGTGERWSRRFDADGLVVAVVSPTGLTEAFTHDAAGRVATSTTPAGGITRSEYDAVGRIVAVTDPAGGTRRFTHDAAGRTTAATDPLGHTTRYAYDDAGRLGSVTDPLGAITRHGYDENGRLSSTTGPLGRTTRFAYDGAGRLTGRTTPDGATVTWAHDGSGRVSGVDRIRIERDELGRAVRLTEPGRPEARLSYDRCGRLAERASGDRSVRWTYDTDGLRTSMAYPDGRALGYAHDGAGRTSTLEHPLLGRVTITRDADGRPVHTDADGWRLTRSYTGGLLTGHQSDRHLTLLTRDEAGRVTTATRDGHPQRFAYDDAGQLTAAGEHTYAYDADGRLVHETAPGGHERRYTYDAAGQLRTAGADTFGYDDNGRRTTHNGRRRYHYDALDRLTRVDGRDLEIDALGELVRAGDTALSWDTADPLSPLTALGEHDIVGDGTPWAVSGGGWLAPDWQGSIGASPTADPWGGAGTDPQLGYRGELALDGLVWLRHRAYDPATRAFLTPDPLPAVPGTAYAANPYHYAGNDPVNHLDPLGLRPATDADLAAQKDDGGLFGAVGHWFGDNWQYVVGGALVVGGLALMATGVGAPLGIVLEAAAADAAIGAGISMIDQKATTGQVSLGKTLIDGSLGAVTGGLGAKATGLMRLGSTINDFLSGAANTEFKAALSPRTTATDLLAKGTVKVPGGELGGTPTSASSLVDRSTVNTSVSAQRQGRHVLDAREYSGGSYFKSANDAQHVLDDFHSGDAAILGNKGRDIVVKTDRVTGFNHNPGTGYPHQPTNVFFIKGTSSPSVVPYNPRWGQ